MYKKIIWPLVIGSAFVLSLLFVSGFIVSIVISGNDDTAQTETEMDMEIPESEPAEDMPPDGASDILVLGDSIGFGVGDEENLGIGERYLNLLDDDSETGKTVTNISVPGFESSQLASLIESDEYSASISSAELIILSIGGNDLNNLNLEDTATLTLAFDETLNIYKENLTFILSEIRSINPDAQLAIIGLYNPYSDDAPQNAPFLLEWNHETRLIVNSDVGFAYIPTYELFDYHLDEYLSPDDFHPNGTGYQAIAEILFRILN
ncbi:Lysophospholipase L1 [Alkalibacterium subtropicum]|uniref:Lysophospholipase L1 n=1 Tax=Alkalibacterium subtropicum TaxID=753702 RepID=A0A1I1FQP5_9LACT|nr:GDSL-type esterase/lipase family protein [Alkalibacterium subtropicum]SFC01332.1 Lysophospholipase L1 [Alkalibacterium subtropicum]